MLAFGRQKKAQDFASHHSLLQVSGGQSGHTTRKSQDIKVAMNALLYFLVIRAPEPCCEQAWPAAKKNPSLRLKPSESRVKCV